MSRLREMPHRPGKAASPQLTNHLICLGIALWVFCEIVFTHSSIGSIDIARVIGFGMIFRASTIALLIASISRQEFDLNGPALALLACALLATCLQWQGLSDVSPLALMLIVLAARNLDISRLARWYTLGALLGVLVVMTCAMFGLSRTSTLLIESSFVPTFGFKDPSTFAYLILSIAASIMIGAEELQTRLICAALCLAAALIVWIQLHVIPIAICFAALVAVVAISVYAPIPLNRISRYVAAALPGILFCLPFGARASFTDPFAIAVLVFLYAYYVLAMLSLGSSTRDRIVRCVCLMYALLLTQGALPMSLEFNCSLLVLSGGIRRLAIRDRKGDGLHIQQEASPSTAQSGYTPYARNE